MRISDLRERLTLSFGEAWAPSFSADIAISLLGSRSVNEALKEEIRDRDRQLFTQNERLCAVEALVEAGRQLSR